MKQITMDFEIYKDEINEAKFDGEARCLRNIVKMAKKEKKLNDILDSADPMLYHENSYWVIIAKALGAYENPNPEDE